MRKNLLLLLSVFIGLSLSAQIYEENFDGFTSGDYLAVVDADNWTTWGDAPGTSEDAMISDAFSVSAPNAVMVDAGTDAVYPCGDLTSGVYSISFDYYVPADKVGYFNIQHIFGSEWVLSVTFMPDLTSVVEAGGVTLNPAWVADTWFHVDVDIDMDTDLATMYWDDVEIITWQWSLAQNGDPGTSQLGVVNMYAYDGGIGGTPEYYFDNFVFELAPTVLYEEDYDDFTSGDYLAVVDPDNWTTWGDAPGTSEDALITDAFSSTAPNAVLVDAGTDAVFPCGDFTSGVFSIDFDYYVPTDRVGYFNIQHIFGSEWVLSVTFMPDLTSVVEAGGVTLNPAWTADTWFHVTVDVDMDTDLATMYWDDEEIISWQWSLAQNGDPGTSQLGVVNMYAYDGGIGGTPEYYFDNFTFVTFSTPVAPATIEIDVDEMMVELGNFGTASESFNIANSGEEDLAYYAYPVYDIDETTGTTESQLSYCDQFDNGVGYTNGVAVKIATLFTPSVVEDYIGTALTAVEFYMNDNALDLVVKVWGPGSTTVAGPGEELASMTFNPNIGAWSVAELDEAIILDGNPIWIGVTYFQPAGLFSMGADIGPKVPGVNYSSTGPAWSELTLDRNWNIRGDLLGDPMTPFMNIPIDMGVILGGGNENVNVDFDASGMDNGQYTGAVVIASSDAETNYSYIDVTLDIVTSVNDITAQDAVMVYPNPASDVIFVKANSVIREVRVSNYLGQLVDVFNFANNEANISVSDYNAGIYFVEVTTIQGKHTIKVVKE